MEKVTRQSPAPHFYFSSEKKLCDLSRENIPYKWTRGKWMDEKRLAKPFEMERLIDEQMMKIFRTDEVERMNRWQKFLNGWMADKNKYLNGWGWTD